MPLTFLVYYVYVSILTYSPLYLYSRKNKDLNAIYSNSILILAASNLFKA